MNYQVNQQEIASVVINGTDVTTTAKEIIEIPANTVVTGIVFEEIEKCDAGKAITLKAKVAHASSGGFNGFVTGTGTELTKDFKSPISKTVTCTVTGGASGETVTCTIPYSFYTKVDDVLTINQQDAALTKGKLRIGLVGFKTGMTDVRTEEDNRAPVDPYTPPEKK